MFFFLVYDCGMLCDFFLNLWLFDYVMMFIMVEVGDFVVLWCVFMVILLCDIFCVV